MTRSFDASFSAEEQALFSILHDAIKHGVKGAQVVTEVSHSDELLICLRIRHPALSCTDSIVINASRGEVSITNRHIAFGRVYRGYQVDRSYDSYSIADPNMVEMVVKSVDEMIRHDLSKGLK